MSLVMLEGFESYGTATGADLVDELCQKWICGNMASDWAALVAGMNNGSALQWDNDETSAGLSLAVAAADTICMGFALKPGSPSGTQTEDLLKLYSGGTLQGALQLTFDGHFLYDRGTTRIGRTENPLTMGTWSYIELKVLIHNTAGTVDIHINGASVLSLSGIDTRPSSVVTINEVQIHAVKYYSWDNIYIYDDVGGAPSMLGPIVIEQLLPTGDDTHNWTQSTGSTGYEVVDNLEIEDSTYVSDSTLNTTELWSYADISEIDGVIVAVQQHTRAGTAGGGMRTLSILCESGVTTDVTSYGLTTDGGFEPLEIIYEVDPNTSSAWTISNLNAANFGVKVGD